MIRILLSVFSGARGFSDWVYISFFVAALLFYVDYDAKREARRELEGVAVINENNDLRGEIEAFEIRENTGVVSDGVVADELRRGGYFRD